MGGASGQPARYGHRHHHQGGTERFDPALELFTSSRARQLHFSRRTLAGHAVHVRIGEEDVVARIEYRSDTYALPNT